LVRFTNDWSRYGFALGWNYHPLNYLVVDDTLNTPEPFLLLYFSYSKAAAFTILLKKHTTTFLYIICQYWILILCPNQIHRQTTASVKTLSVLSIIKDTRQVALVLEYEVYILILCQINCWAFLRAINEFLNFLVTLLSKIKARRYKSLNLCILIV